MQHSLSYHLMEEDVPAAAIDYSNLGVLFSKMNLTDSSIYYLKKSMLLAEEIGDIQLSAKTRLNCLASSL